MGQWRLSRATIQNFKSIKKLTIPIGDGFTILTGANGSGKSNVMEAIIFGLGEGPHHLRVSSLNELHNFSKDSKVTTSDNNGDKIAVELTFVNRNDNVMTHVGSSIINRQRTYFVDTKTVTKQKFEKYIHITLGFAREKKCFVIKQHASQKIISASPTQLFSYLCDTAGTQAILTARNKAASLIIQSQKSMENVKAMTEKLEEEIQTDMRYFLALQSVKKAKSQLDRMVSEYFKFKYLNFLNDQFNNLEMLGQSLINRQKEKKNQSKLVEDVQVIKDKLHAFRSISNNAKTLDNKNKGFTELDLLAEKEHLGETLKRIIQAKKKIDCSKNDVSVTIGEIQSQKNLAKQRMTRLEQVEIPKCLCDISQWEEQSKTFLASSVPSHSFYLHQKRKQQQLFRNLEREMMEATSSCLVLVDQEQKARMELNHATRCVELQQLNFNKALMKLKELNSDRAIVESQSIDEENLLSCGHVYLTASENYLNNARRELSDLQSELDAAKQKRSNFRRSILKLDVDVDIGHFGPRDFGCLADVLTLAATTSASSGEHNYDAYLLNGLQHIIGHNLGVRLCLTQADAVAILKQYENEQQLGNHKFRGKLRIWPMDALRVTCSRTTVYTALVEPQHCAQQNCTSDWQAVDPVLCFAIVNNDELSEFFARVLYKACNTWILTRNDNIAEEIMQNIVKKSQSCQSTKKQYKQDSEVGIMGCVTSCGNKHTIGGMHIVKKMVDTTLPPPVAHLIDYQNLNEDIRKKQERINELSVKMKVKAQIYVQIRDAMQHMEDLDNLRTTEASAASSHKLIREQLEAKESERNDINKQISQALVRVRDINSILNKFSTNDSNEEAVIPNNDMSTYTTKHIKEYKDKLLELETKLQDSDEALHSMEGELIELKEQLQDLRSESDKHEKKIVEHKTKYNEICKQTLKLKQQIIPDNFDQQQEKHILESDLEAKTQELSKSKTCVEEYTTTLNECTKNYLSNEYIEVGKNLGEWAADYNVTTPNFIANHFDKKLKECDLQCCEVVSSQQLKILKEIGEYFEDEGEMFSLRLQEAPVLFTKNISSEVQRMRHQCESSFIQYRNVTCDFFAVKEEEHQSGMKTKSLAKNKHFCGKNSRMDHNTDDNTSVAMMNKKVSQSMEKLSLCQIEMQVEQKQSVVSSLKAKYIQTMNGLTNLENNLTSLQTELNKIHQYIYERVQQRFSNYFDDLVNLDGVTCKLVPVNRLEHDDILHGGKKQDETKDSQLTMEAGFKIILQRIKNSDPSESECVSIRGLSCGQQTLLGLALVFACALTTSSSGHRSPLYILDEIDANLDEANQSAAAKAVVQVFMKNNQQQVLCVSHNKNFLTNADSIISVQMVNGQTTIRKN